MNEPQFLNPYSGCYKEPTHYKATVRIPRSAFERIARCRLDQGTFETTLALLISKLIYELDERGITDLTHARHYEQLLSNAFIGCYTGVRVPGGTTTQEPHPQTDLPNDGPRTSNLPNQDPQPQRTTEIPQTKRRGKGRKETGG